MLALATRLDDSFLASDMSHALQIRTCTIVLVVSPAHRGFGDQLSIGLNLVS